MGFRENIRKLAYNLRRLPGERFGIRPYTVAVLIREWDGGEVGQGTLTETLTPIVEANGQPPKVHWLTSEELAVGGLPAGTVEIGPVTPDFPGGGTTLATLQPDLDDSSELFYVLTGPEYPSGGKFRLTGVRTDRTFGYRVTLEKSGD